MDSCWLERVRLPRAVEAIVGRLVEQMAAHLAECAEAACLHVAHGLAAPGSGDRAA